MNSRFSYTYLDKSGDTKEYATLGLLHDTNKPTKHHENPTAHHEQHPEQLDLHHEQVALNEHKKIVEKYATDKEISYSLETLGKELDTKGEQKAQEFADRLIDTKSSGGSLDDLMTKQPESYKLSLIKLTDIVLKFYAHLAKSHKALSTQDINSDAFLQSVRGLDLQSLAQLPDLARQHGYTFSKEDQGFLQSLQVSYPTEYQHTFASSVMPTIHRILPDLIAEYNDAHGLIKAGASTLDTTNKFVNKTIDRAGDHPVMAVTSIGLVGLAYRRFRGGSADTSSDDSSDSQGRSKEQTNKKQDKQSRSQRLQDLANPFEGNMLSRVLKIGGYRFAGTKAWERMKDLMNQDDQKNDQKKPKAQKPKEKQDQKYSQNKKESEEHTTTGENDKSFDGTQDVKNQEPEINQPTIDQAQNLAVEHQIPFVHKQQLLTRLAGLSASDQQALLDEYHLQYFPEEEKFLPVEGYQRQYAKDTQTGKALSPDEQSVIDAVNVKVMPRIESKEDKANKEAQKSDPELVKTHDELVRERQECLQRLYPKKDAALLTARAVALLAHEKDPDHEGQIGSFEVIVQGKKEMHYFAVMKEGTKTIYLEDTNKASVIEQLATKNPEKVLNNLDQEIKTLSEEAQKKMKKEMEDIEKMLQKKKDAGASEKELQEIREKEFKRIEKEIGVINSKISSLDILFTRCLLSVSDPERLQKIFKNNKKAADIAANNGGVKGFGKTAQLIKKGAKGLMLMPTLFSISKSPNAGWELAELGTEMTPFLGSGYLLWKAATGSGMNGEVGVYDRVVAGATGAVSLLLDAGGFWTFGGSTRLATTLKGATKGSKVIQTAKRIGQGVNIASYAMAGWSVGSAAVQIGMDRATISKQTIENNVTNPVKATS